MGGRDRSVNARAKQRRESSGIGRRGQRLLRQVGDDGLVQDLQHGRLGLNPDQVGGTPGFPAARLAVLQTEIEADGAVDGLNDFADGSLAAAGQNLKAS